MKHSERMLIAKYYGDGLSVKEMAERMHKSTTSIYRELDRGYTGKIVDGRLEYDFELSEERKYLKQLKKLEANHAKKGSKSDREFCDGDV